MAVGCGGWYGRSKSAVKKLRGAGPFGILLPSRWNHVGFVVSGLLAAAESQVAAAGQTGEGHGVGGGLVRSYLMIRNESATSP